MQMTQDITLPKTEDFYTKPYEFSVSLVGGACRDYVDPGPPRKVLPLHLDSSMQKAIQGYGPHHKASLEDIAASSIQFFRTAAGDSEILDHHELRFMMAYDFGRVMTCGLNGNTGTRLGPATRTTSMRHSEAVKRTTEMFGYGLSLHFTASVLGVPTDRFTFILGSGSRPDFEATFTPDEIIAAAPTLQTLNPAGQRVYVEVKARVTWGSMRERNDSTGLLLNCARKAESCSDGIFLAILIALPPYSDSPRRTPHILVADPNDPPALSPEKQAEFLLERYLFHAQRYGLHLLKLRILQWLRQLDVDLSEVRRGELQDLEAKYQREEGTKDPLLVRREVNGRTCQGRFFSSLLERLGRPGNRRLTIEEAERALEDDGPIGKKYFAGVDEDLVTIIASQHMQRLLTFGVRGMGSVDLTAKSAFRTQDYQVETEERKQVRNAISQALGIWRQTRQW